MQGLHKLCAWLQVATYCVLIKIDLMSFSIIDNI